MSGADAGQVDTEQEDLDRKWRALEWHLIIEFLLLFQNVNFKLQYMKHNIKICKTIIQLSLIFITTAFYYESCKSGRKMGEMEWGGRQL